MSTKIVLLYSVSSLGVHLLNFSKPSIRTKVERISQFMSHDKVHYDLWFLRGILIFNCTMSKRIGCTKFAIYKVGPGFVRQMDRRCGSRWLRTCMIYLRGVYRYLIWLRTYVLTLHTVQDTMYGIYFVFICIHKRRTSSSSSHICPRPCPQPLSLSLSLSSTYPNLIFPLSPPLSHPLSCSPVPSTLSLFSFLVMWLFQLNSWCLWVRFL